MSISALRRELTRGPPARMPAPLHDRGPAPGRHAVRFLDRSAIACAMFCAGESGAIGLVCGAPTRPGAPWCVDCRRLVYMPAQGRAA